MHEDQPEGRAVNDDFRNAGKDGQRGGGGEGCSCAVRELRAQTRDQVPKQRSALLWAMAACGEERRLGWYTPGMRCSCKPRQWL